MVKERRAYYLFLLVVYLFALQFALMRYISFFQYWDELYAILSIPLFLIRFDWKFRIKKKNKYINAMVFALILFVIIGVLSNLIFRYQKFIAVIKDVFINLKFFLGILTTYFLFKGFQLSRYKNGIRMHVEILIALYFVLVIQNKLTHVFPVANVRFGIASEKIFFNHPTELASATFFLLLMLMVTYKKLKQSGIFIAMASIVVLSTLRFKAIASVMLFIYIFLIVESGKKMKFVYLVPLIPFGCVLGWHEIFYYFFSSSSMNTARGALSYACLKVARDLFPLGSGFGTFASWMSGVYYSPLYPLYGIDTVWGLGVEWPELVSDVFWPMVIAQNGFFGLLLYIFIVYCLYKLIIQWSKGNRRMFLAGIGSLSYLLISSVAESAFVNPLSLPLSFIIGLCACSYKQVDGGIVK